MGDNPLIRSLYRKAENLGPAIPFVIETGEGERVGGVVRRLDISFSHVGNLPAAARGRVRGFLESFGIGRVEEMACGG